MFTVTYSYSRPIVRCFYFRELWHKQGGWLLALPPVLAMAYWATRDPDSWWFGGFLTGFCVAYGLLVYDGYRQVELFPFDQPVTTTITESGLHFSSKLVTSRCPLDVDTSGS